MALMTVASTDHPFLLITADEEEALAYRSDFEELGLTAVRYLPQSGRKPHDRQQMEDPSILVQRSEVLDALSRADCAVVVAPIHAVMERLASPEAYATSSIRIELNQIIDPEALWEQLLDQGYKPVSFVDEPGEIARRGGILDVYPYTGGYPVRIEFFGDSIDSLREFDAGTQRSIAFLQECRLIPDIRGKTGHDRDSIFAYLPGSAAIVMVNEPLVQARMEELWRMVDAAGAEAGYLDPDAMRTAATPHAKIEAGAFTPTGAPDLVIKVGARPQPDFNGTVKLLKPWLADARAKGMTTWILCDSQSQRDRVEELLDIESDEALRLAQHTLHQGFILDAEHLAVFTDHQIFNRYHRPKGARNIRRGGFSIKEAKDLKVGDYVVHVDYGIGTFAGFTNITVREARQEAVVVRYADDSILYVNVSSLHKLQKYSGKDGAAPPVTKLGSGEWQRKKAKTKSRVKDIARELIQLYARRKAQRAHAYPSDTGMQLELEAAFEYEETPDQWKAIEDVKRDMEKPHPMDRLVCGDVGFGKTEVAVRAAFKAVSDGKQVAVLVPTTILADQHWKTFSRRMKDLPVTVERVSRFRSTSEISEILKRLKNGEIDILIGTHRLVSKDVAFKDLGLLVIDEEQRFGVSTKEKLKEFRATVDVLTLTATPIPRTLQFSLMGARDLSVITTPPPNRQPVYTEIHSFDSALIREAILNEMQRNGQVFFIHNRVQNIEEMAGMIRDLVPNVRVRHAHGQMSGPDLEKIILDFYDHKFDVLVSTNIVENGIDISNANTILIHRADQFGLSELHQLRGRVGRSNRKAFCYLITPPLEDLSVESRKRLLALVEHSDLGSGFNIAMRDLDIRGAGDILGAEQSGFISDIGFDLYTKILNDAVRELKETEFKDLFADAIHEIPKPETVVEFDVSALLEVRYVQDPVERLNLYRELSRVDGLDAIDDWSAAVADRFGALPPSARALVAATRVKVLASKLYLPKVVVRGGRMWLELPDGQSEAGTAYFQKGKFQDLLARIEVWKPGGFRVTNKDEVVRLVLEPVADLDAAAACLLHLQETHDEPFPA
jgi:transcription-repair coupling factor (superfamily II helicase)